MKQVKLVLSIISFVCFTVASPYSVWGTDDANNHLPKYPGTNTSVNGSVVVGSTTVPFDIQILADDWTTGLDPVTQLPFYKWSLTGYEIMNGSTVVATIDSLDLLVDFDPYVRLNFAVSAGSADTTFLLNSSVVSFATLNNPLAYASAGLTLTGDGDGAAVTGLYSPGKSYKAIYNGSSLFGYLSNSFSVELDNTATSSERKPLASGTWETIPGSVSSIQSQFNFTLSAADSASGTSRFEVKVPEPATICMLSLGALVLLRKRRA